jgi:hypothetical protein
MNSLTKLISAYHLDPARIVQQSVCYDHRRKWSISISWGYTIQIYTSLVIIADLQMPFQTFKTWRSSSDGPFTFNTRWLNPDECQQPSIFFLDKVRKVGTGSVTSYKRYFGKEGKKCKRADGEVQRIKVSVLKLDSEYWKNVLISLSLSHTHTHTHTQRVCLDRQFKLAISIAKDKIQLHYFHIIYIS